MLRWSRIVPDAFPLPFHGGDIDAIATRYEMDGAGWLDFSANINPAGPPPAVLEVLRTGAQDVASLMRYPTSRDRALGNALASVVGVAAEQIVIANGSSALIEAFVRTVAPRRCLVPQPAFSEYARALKAQGCETIPFILRPEDDFSLDVRAFVTMLQRERPDACILTNPHNPSGGLIGRDDMRTILENGRALRVAMLVDEAFIDFVPEASVVDSLETGDAALVMRSVTKFYAMPALRVGYGVAPPDFARAVVARIPSWPVTSLAADAAIAALGDEDYVRSTCAGTASERERFATELRAAGVKVFPSAANFLLFASMVPSAVLTDCLARRHRIVVRDCATYPGLEDGGFIRICVRSHRDDSAFVAALTKELHAVWAAS